MRCLIVRNRVWHILVDHFCLMPRHCRLAHSLVSSNIPRWNMRRTHRLQKVHHRRVGVPRQSAMQPVCVDLEKIVRLGRRSTGLSSQRYKLPRTDYQQRSGLHDRYQNAQSVKAWAMMKTTQRCFWAANVINERGRPLSARSNASFCQTAKETQVNIFTGDVSVVGHNISTKCLETAMQGFCIFRTAA